MAKIITAEEAAKLIKDNDVIAFAPDSLAGFPTEITFAIRDRFLKEGHPADITTVRAPGLGTFEDDEYGEGCFCVEGLLKCSISSYVATSKRLARFVEEDRVQAYMFPMGPLHQIFREVGRGMPGVLTKIGLGTFADPRLDGGKCNDNTRQNGEDLVEYIPDFRGEEYLHYRTPSFNVALLRGTRADVRGNVSMEKEPIEVEILAVAQAVKACGGTVIVQVEDIVDLHEIHPKSVKLPGIYVDYIVKAEDTYNIPQLNGRLTQDDYNYSFTGDEIADVGEAQPMPFDYKKVIARRAAMELRKGDMANFGLGMPQNIPTILAEYGLVHDIYAISETGAIGGTPAMGKDFGCHWNPEALCDNGMHFSFFNGGNLDIGVFGLSEVDRSCNINTCILNGVIKGIGGFTDITQSSRRTNIFMGTFTASGIKADIRDGKLVILQEGRFKKFIDKVDTVTFSAGEYMKNHEDILFITERCVIRFTKEGFVLEEVAPGIDIETQILGQCDVELRIPEGGPKLMDASLFTPDGFELTLPEAE